MEGGPTSKNVARDRIRDFKETKVSIVIYCYWLYMLRKSLPHTDYTLNVFLANKARDNLQLE